MFLELACAFQQEMRLAALGWGLGWLLKSKTEAVPQSYRYLCYLFFTLHTHKDLFAQEEGGNSPTLSLSGAIAGLCTITVLVAFSSE